MSINGVSPTSLTHIKELLGGKTGKVLIFIGNSAQYNKMHNYHEEEYSPSNFELEIVDQLDKL